MITETRIKAISDQLFVLPDEEMARGRELMRQLAEEKARCEQGFFNTSCPPRAGTYRVQVDGKPTTNGQTRWAVWDGQTWDLAGWPGVVTGWWWYVAVPDERAAA